MYRKTMITALVLCVNVLGVIVSVIMFWNQPLNL